LSAADEAAQYLGAATGTCRFTADGAELAETSTGKAGAYGAIWSGTVADAAETSGAVAAQIVYLVSGDYLAKITLPGDGSKEYLGVTESVAAAMDAALHTQLAQVIAGA
jgi:hypothetical protein